MAGELTQEQIDALKNGGGGTTGSKAGPRVVKAADGSQWLLQVDKDGYPVKDADGNPRLTQLTPASSTRTEAQDQLASAQAGAAPVNANANLTSAQAAQQNAANAAARVASQNALDTAQAGAASTNANANLTSAQAASQNAASTAAKVPSQIALNQAQAQAANLQAQVAAGQLTLNQAKQKWDEINNLVTATGNAEQNFMTQGNTRATLANSTLNNAMDFATKLAPMMGANSDLAGNAFMQLLNLAPKFQQMMGGAPLSPQQSTTLRMIGGLAQQKGLPLGTAASLVANHFQNAANPSPMMVTAPQPGAAPPINGIPDMTTMRFTAPAA